MAVRNACLLVAALLWLAACNSEPGSNRTGNENTGTPTSIEAEYILKQADTLYRRGRYKAAIVSYDRCRYLFEGHKDWEGATKSYARMGKSALQVAEYEDAEKYLNLALRYGQLYLSHDHASLGETHHALGLLQRVGSRYDAAENSLTKALDIFIHNYGERHSFVATTYADLGALHIQTSEFDTAERTLHKAVDISLQLKDDNYLELIRSYSALGYLLKFKGRYEQARDTLQRAIRIGTLYLGRSHPDLALAYQYLGETYRLKGDYEEAQKSHIEALRIAEANFGPDHPDVGGIANDLGIVYVVLGDAYRGIEQYENHLRIALKLHGNKHRDVAISYNNQSNAWREIGELDLARDLVNAAIAINKNIFGDSHEAIAVNLNNLGKIYAAEGEFEKASEVWMRSLNMFIEAHGENHPYVANQYRSLGDVNLRLGNADIALMYLKKALATFLSTSGELDPYVSTMYRSLGIAHDAIGDYEGAIHFHTMALKHRNSDYGGRHPLVAESYNDIGDIYRANSKFDLALYNYEKALNANLKKDSGHALPSADDADVILSDAIWMKSLWGKGRVLSSRPDAGISTVSYLTEAVESYLEAAKSIDRLRRHLRTEGAKLRRAEIEAPLLFDAVETSLRLFSLTGDEQYKSTAFYFAEKSKAGLLLEAFSESRARRFAGIPDSLIDREGSLISRLTAAKQLLVRAQSAGAGQSSRTERLEQEVFLAEQKRDEFIRGLETSFPEYYKLKYEVDVATSKDVMQYWLDPETALVEYVIGDDKLIVFTITKSATDAVMVPFDSSVEQSIKAFREGILKQNYEQYVEHAALLYRQLVAPIASKLNAEKLIIIPDGILNYVPFEVLLTEDVSGDQAVKSYGRLPYLINDYQISYAYSATLLMETRERATQRPRQDFMAFAPVFEGGLPITSRGGELLEVNRRGFDRSSESWFSGYLPMSRTEVTTIHKLFASKYNLLDRFFSPKAKVYLEESASEENLKKSSLEDYRYVHFATHSFANETVPEATGIIMYPEENPSLDEGVMSGREDGVLRLGEVYNLKLNADLVVLSACETGIGPVARGEGVLGLTRGFLYAGASNVLVSLWSADDAQTSTLMVDFYKELLDGHSKPEALRAAKLNIIRTNSRYARPYYWAPFVLIGN